MILTAIAALAPSLAGLIFGDKGKEVAETAVGVAKQLTGESSDEAALAALKANPELLVQWQEAMHSYSIAIQEQLTRRHEADMQSDSWLAKNVRPLCLVGLTLAITVGVWLPDQYISSARFIALTDMSQWVYGYYFVGRSTEKTGGLEGLTGMFRRGK
ncbi:hypothetical protein [Pseudodesulfovibrio pelocollis]|uniref:hypothetical protein n=1 Tax=Pseudodesulfovibrio pelocollis TaxID=3051432 RepID=UPI00255B0B73|nr:hypothetical protein [Pseudodesulfovibrio sp. SB368]